MLPLACENTPVTDFEESLEAMRRLVCAMLLAAAPLLAWAQPYLSAPEAAAVREVIEAQLDAFKRDDAQRAFSFAAPGIRQMFGTAENFLQMVRSSYAVVWIALYAMERQPDGSWRINGCQLARLAGRET